MNKKEKSKKRNIAKIGVRKHMLEQIEKNEWEVYLRKFNGHDMTVAEVEEELDEKE